MLVIMVLALVYAKWFHKNYCACHNKISLTHKRFITGLSQTNYHDQTNTRKARKPKAQNSTYFMDFVEYQLALANALTLFLKILVYP
jgi:hypothetical protein